jgi:predicted kinase
MTELVIPEVSLVVLVGITGSGKSTFARTHFAPTQVLSSDTFRAMVADDENDQSASPAAFDALHHVAGLRLRAGRLTIVDATNVQPYSRAALIRVAREHDVLPVAIVLDVSVEECWRRTQQRPERDFGRAVVARQHRELRRDLASLAREGFRVVHVLHGPEEVAAATISLERLHNDRRDLAGPFDIVGDVHGCREELERLLQRLGYEIVRDPQGRACDARHPQARSAIFLGDLVDRGPDVPGVLRLAMGMVAAGNALAVAGNHEAKLLRALAGRRVTVSHGLGESLAQLDACDQTFRADVVRFLDRLVAHYVLDGGRLVVAHAGLKEAYHGRASGRVRSFALYGQTTGETDDSPAPGASQRAAAASARSERQRAPQSRANAAASEERTLGAGTKEHSLPVRYPWATEYRGAATVVYGHTPTPKPEWVNNTICIDTGAVFGGWLTALRYPSRELVSVPAARVYYEPSRPLAEPAAALPSEVGALLRVADVTGRRWIDTGYGRVAVAAENAAAALEVMGRFAIDPADLYWLPPTMAPCSTSTMEGYRVPGGGLRGLPPGRRGPRRLRGQAHGLTSGRPGPPGGGWGPLHTHRSPVLPGSDAQRGGAGPAARGGDLVPPLRRAGRRLDPARRGTAAVVGQGSGTRQGPVRERGRGGASGAARDAGGARRRRGARTERG